MKKMLLFFTFILLLSVIPVESFADGTVICSFCGREIADDAVFCQYCGKMVSVRNNASTEIKGTPGTGNYIISFEDGITIIEEKYITVKLMSFYEEKTNWSTGAEIEKCVEFKIHNNSEREFILNLEKAYIGEDSVKILMMDTKNGPLPGKSQTFRYKIRKDRGANGAALDALEDLYQLEGRFNLSIYTEDKSAISKNREVSFTLQNMADGGSAEEKAAAVADAEEIDQALQGTWTLYGDNKFIFDNGNIKIKTGGSTLKGTYKVNTEDSTIDAKLKANDGTVKIHLPYAYQDGLLKVWNNHHEELERK